MDLQEYVSHVHAEINAETEAQFNQPSEDGTSKFAMRVDYLSELLRQATVSPTILTQERHFEQMHAVADELKRRQPGLAITVEGGGACCPFLQINFWDGSILVFGDAGDQWGADVYADVDAVAAGEAFDSLDSELPSVVYHPVAVVDTFLKMTDGYEPKAAAAPG